MSLPREILDQLLSGYLDDALSADERARVEQLVRDDPDVARELEDLRELSVSLRAIKQADSRFKLEDGFADRVLDSAVAQATAEGLGEDHPLVQLAAQPSSAADPKSTTSWRMIGAMLALAASLAIAFIAFRGDPADPELIAQVDPDENRDPLEIPDQPIDDPGEERIVVVDPATDPVVGPEMVADADVPDAADVKAPAADVPPGTNNAVVVNNNNDNSTPEDPKQPVETKRVGLRGILVIDAPRTESGRESSAVAAAMRLAEIAPGHKKQITDEVVASIRNPDADRNDDSIAVIYLEAPAKQLDRFINNLFVDTEGIETVGFTAIMDPPLMRVVQSIKSIDPTQIRHRGGVAWQLQGESPEAINTFTQSLVDQPFIVDKKRERLPSMSKGPDEIAHLLVLVR